MYYVLQGRDIIPCDMHIWAEWLERDYPERVIGYWEFTSCKVSTVFMGLDHGHSFSMVPSRPILFETLVFGGPMEGDGERYSTYDEAEAGHMRYCQLVSAAEAALHWRKRKRYRNKHEKERRQMNNRIRRRRMLDKMRELTDKMSKEKV